MDIWKTLYVYRMSTFYETFLIRLTFHFQKLSHFNSFQIDKENWEKNINDLVKAPLNATSYRVSHSTGEYLMNSKGMIFGDISDSSCSSERDIYVCFINFYCHIMNAIEIGKSITSAWCARWCDASERHECPCLTLGHFSYHLPTSSCPP